MHFELCHFLQLSRYNQHIRCISPPLSLQGCADRYLLWPQQLLLKDILMQESFSCLKGKPHCRLIVFSLSLFWHLEDQQYFLRFYHCLALTASIKIFLKWAYSMYLLSPSSIKSVLKASSLLKSSFPLSI